MTLADNTLSYYTPQPGGDCPLCRKRPIKKPQKFAIYGHPVCRKCYYAFANRRELAYLIDALLFQVPEYIFFYALGIYLAHTGMGALGIALVDIVAGIPLLALFMMKDGFRGQSPGKYLMNV